MADQSKIISGKEWFHDVSDVYTSRQNADFHARTMKGYAFIKDTLIEEMTDGSFWLWYRM